ncbi:glycoside hydrolase family 140 protein [Petrimonas sulfuriphila]|jgi:hypothetical protein|uniref:glycoside hydrolase family 140 protein n=2 Tax=Petrimonas TaxID=307628 RepID=UPI002B3F8112|nr:glycoside hydrolase family 140 protein [Petrimonas sp.]
MKKMTLLTAVFALAFSLYAQIGVDSTQTYLVTKKDGKPFFWMGDTGWELFHRLTREEAVYYLNTRQKQGFNVIMAVALAESNGIRQPNLYGDVPFKNLETLEWDVTPGNSPDNTIEYDYWDHVDFVVREAAKRNLYIGLLPAWGDKVAYQWGEGPMIFNNKPDEAYAFVRKLAERYKSQWNIIWILGGDRAATYERNGRRHDDRPVWRAMAKAIEDTCGKDVFITYHPGWPETSAYLQHEDWLDMHAHQSGHGSRVPQPWDIIANDLKKTPKRPSMDLEPCYEDHPVNPWDNKWTRAERGYFDDYDVRARIYRGVFAGGAGATYGHHQVWQFLDTTRNAPIWTGDILIGWRRALTANAAGHIHHLKDLMLSRPDFNRTTDSTLVVSDRGNDYRDIIIATRNQKATYAMVYLPQPKPVQIDLNKLSSGRKKVSWFNPTTGKYHEIKGRYTDGVQLFTPPDREQKDWVLVIDVK